MSLFSAFSRPVTYWNGAASIAGGAVIGGGIGALAGGKRHRKGGAIAGAVLGAGLGSASIGYRGFGIPMKRNMSRWGVGTGMWKEDRDLFKTTVAESFQSAATNPNFGGKLGAHWGNRAGKWPMAGQVREAAAMNDQIAAATVANMSMGDIMKAAPRKFRR